MSVLHIDTLTKKYPLGGGWFRPAKEFFTAVNGITFSLEPGEVLGFLGPNGAGKTTTLHMLLGTLTPTSGTITYFGKDFAKHRSEILQKVGFASAYTRLPGRLTVYENLDIYARLYGVKSHERAASIKQFLDAFSMWDLKDRYVAGLSAGQLTRVMLAKAFLPKPTIVLLDEPTASLDPDIAQEVRHFVAQQQQKYGTAILFASHNMAEVSEVCNRVLVLKQGNIIASDTPKNLAATVSLARIELTIVDGFEKTIAYAESNKLRATVQERLVAIEIDEHLISKLLAELAALGIAYSHIAINKPTLEDYFLQVASSSAHPAVSAEALREGRKLVEG